MPSCYLEGDSVPGVDHAARHLVGGEAELGEARVVQQLRGQDVDRALPEIGYLGICYEKIF